MYIDFCQRWFENEVDDLFCLFRLPPSGSSADPSSNVTVENIENRSPVSVNGTNLTGFPRNISIILAEEPRRKSFLEKWILKKLVNGIL